MVDTTTSTFVRSAAGWLTVLGCVLLRISDAECGWSPQQFAIDSDSDDRRWLDDVNAELLRTNQLTAFYAWHVERPSNDTITTADDDIDTVASFNAAKAEWTNLRCSEARQRARRTAAPLFARIAKLLCRCPRLDAAETRHLSRALAAMQQAFVGSAVCIPRALDVCGGFARVWHETFVRRIDGSVWPLRLRPEGNRQQSDDDVSASSPALRCFAGEPDLDRLMAGDHSALFDTSPICSIDPYAVARWAWEAWRLAVGPAVWRAYAPAIRLMNVGARRNGFADIGAVWRAELELPQLPERAAALWQAVRPLHERLHAVLRNALHRKLATSEHRFERAGPVPAHLLGSMWSQDWRVYWGLLRPPVGEAEAGTTFADRVQRKRWSGRQLVEHADDFYASMGLPRMSPEFWRRSVFDDGGGSANDSATTTSCHGTAANMYCGVGNDGGGNVDVRVVVCVPASGGTVDDLYVAVHELGHVHYFLGLMAGQPPVFQVQTW